MPPAVNRLRFVIRIAVGLCRYFMFGQMNSRNNGSGTGF
jgi:hypothetical protein